jgi:hypothetical protein
VTVGRLYSFERDSGVCRLGEIEDGVGSEVRVAVMAIRQLDRVQPAVAHMSWRSVAQAPPTTPRLLRTPT